MPALFAEFRAHLPHAAVAACVLAGLLLFAAIPLLQTPPHWTSVLWVLASELVAVGLVLSFIFRQRLGFHSANPRPDESLDERDTRWTRDTVLSFGILGLLGLLVLSLSVAPLQTWREAARVFGVAAMYAGAFFGIGAFIGFLFGIPRSLQGKGAPKPDSTKSTQDTKDSIAAKDAGSGSGAKQTPENAIYATNTNLEEISDWLTKIIVGLGLINLKTVPGQLMAMAHYFSQSCDSRICESVALAIILYFFTCGFFLAYLMTRLYLMGAFSRADRSAALERAQRRNEINTKVAQVMREAESSALSEQGDIQPLLERQAFSAQVIANLAGTTNKPTFQHELQTLAKRYEDLRESMKAGDARTRQMEAIAAGMRSYALTSYNLLQQFAASPSAGGRLIAVSFLEVQPDCGYVDWLGGRFAEDKPFIQYHAAVALREAARKLREQCKEQVRAAAQRAIDLLGPEKGATDRFNVLQQVLSELGN
jgi:hypothetical protein